MKKYILINLFLTIVNVAAIAQIDKYSLQEGVVTSYEMEMTEYILDKDAEAVVLYEEGKNYFVPNSVSGGFLLHMERFIKIKILKQAGIKYGEFEIPYYIGGIREIEEVYDLRGATYNMEKGRLEKTVLNSKNVFKEIVGENMRMMKFAMPDVREGSVIEFKYTIKTPYFFNMREWQFQKKIPVVYSVLMYTAIPYYEYTYIMKGATKFDEYNRQERNDELRFDNLVYREVMYTFGMKNLPAFKDEEFISSPNDYMILLNFQISKIYSQSGSVKEVMSTWPKICDDFLKDSNFGKYIKSSEKEGKKILGELNLQGLSDIDKIKRITEYVKFNYNWDGYNDKYTSNKVSAFLKQKTGNAADINLFLIGLLRAAGINADPVVLSTRKNGTINIRYPFSKFLNYVIVQASAADELYFIDATVSALAFDELPERCTNVNGLIVKSKSDEWIGIVQNNLALTQKTFHIAFNETIDAVNVDTEIKAYSFDAYYYRTRYKGVEGNIAEYLQAQGANPIGEIKVENYTDVEQPIIISYHSNAAIDVIDDELYVKPFLNQSITDNIFKQAKRTLPVDLIYRQGYSFSSVIEIPKGYKVGKLPKNIYYNKELVTIDYKTVVNENTVTVSAVFEFKKSFYDAKDYSLLKEAYSTIVGKFNEMIMFVKDSVD
ncbi:MAG: DUF3857 domain-containing protein [Prevotellaceae bacterium]|jgi:transglutaminase-like putative cysteine protease|nr:DUF3857 domain-containing protein [Prevotellaceae bacterium]